MTTAAAPARTVDRDLAPEPGGVSARLSSIDIIRGAVMVLMAIDHVRVFAAVPAGGPSTAVFFTRWVTHFCAPAFLFLAGTSAFLMGRRREGLPRFLLTRGLWLILLELTVIRLSWTFNLEFRQYEMAGVIWVIGWCMIIMAGLVRLPLRVVAAIGLAIILFHNVLDSYTGALLERMGNDPLSNLWRVLYAGFFAGPVRMAPGGPNLIVLYSIIPWIGVMAAGYAFGSVMTMEPARRDRLCLTIGLSAIAAFLVLRGFNLYGDPGAWSPPSGDASGPQLPALLSFLNTTKYPASLLFLLMTLGPTIALIPVLERARGRVAAWMTTFGRVPFFFYVLHIPLIHAAALVVSRIRHGTVVPWLFENHPMGVSSPPPAGYRWSLWLLYLVWLVVCVILYFACRWYAGVKARRKDWWLSYL